MTDTVSASAPTHLIERELWYDKYRPKTLNDYVFATPGLREQIELWIQSGTIPSLMLCGGPGRGKTSLANLLITALLGVEESDVLRLKGSKDNNVETMRTDVKEFCDLGGWSGLRIVFFDEADMLSRTAQEALRNIIDDYSGNVRFIFTCNHPHRIEQAVSESRMLRIDIEKLPEDDYLDRIVDVLLNEKINVETQEAADAIMQTKEICYPDLRRALNLLQNSIRNGKLDRVIPLKSTTVAWESYFTSLFVEKHSAVREVTKIRETLMSLIPDEMEEVYKFLYHNGTKLFADKQIKAIFIINNGQKSHRNALLPDMILLQVIVSLMTLMHDE